MRYDSIIWDFDGTLFDTYPAMCRDLQQVMADLGVRTELEDLVARFTVSRGTVLEWCGEQAGLPAGEIDRVYRAWVAEHGQPEAHPFPHVREFLAQFQAAGGKNFVFTHRSGSVHDYLAGEDLTKYFTDVVSAGTTYARKPDPAGNLHLIETGAWTGTGLLRWGPGNWTFWRPKARAFMPVCSAQSPGKRRRTAVSGTLRSWTPWWAWNKRRSLCCITFWRWATWWGSRGFGTWKKTCAR